jgi:hypothetical protein
MDHFRELLNGMQGAIWPRTIQQQIMRANDVLFWIFILLAIGAAVWGAIDASTGKSWCFIMTVVVVMLSETSSHGSFEAE